jgi:hypothetical protein
MGNAPCEVADVFRKGFSSYCEEYGPLPKEHYTIANAIMSCHTAALGGHVYCCDHCGRDLISYNSCRNRHCPSCQGSARAQWVEKRVEEVLPIPYFHAVFTIPSQLNPFILRNKVSGYTLLFKAASETLLELANDPKHLGAKSGFICVLHTWGQNLLDHPHLHCIIPNGGLCGDQWCDGKNDNFLFPVDVVSVLFRGKFMAYFKEALLSGALLLHGDLQQYDHSKAQLQSIIDQCYSVNWNVYLELPFGSPVQVLKYIGRYTHRVAIANNRIVAVTDTHVTFRWKDYADKNRTKIMTLTHVEFIRRFLLHVLPKGFMRIRYYGFLGSRIRKQSLQCCRDQLCGNDDAHCHESVNDQTAQNNDESVGTEPGFVCPYCREGRMQKQKKLFSITRKGDIRAAA